MTKINARTCNSLFFKDFLILVFSTNKLRLRKRTWFSLLLHVLKYVKPSLILFDIRIYDNFFLTGNTNSFENDVR